ncbi:response regulator [Halanaerobium hydrogeniformans]|uniref:Stage 0 sporulation protein A homolog n=1 Tax=Halanaerobium hydrogeniformans TaxID=656519 RepID=E4RPH8_HALHG|nr:response regulator [Halanaerobium hydrogeniformans]ADQ14001.1 response regulator receiver and SARP domain protein [Halanaerobium hydrogeniformans]
MFNTVIINDNANYFKEITSLISQNKELNLIANYENPIRCLTELKKDKRELKVVIMTTNIMGYSGLEVAKQIHHLDKKIKIIFIADNHDYAVEAFDVGAFDYLLWPVEEKRFRETINRLEE